MLDQETWVEWSPDKSSIFGSSTEDGVLNIWDHNKVGERSGPASKFAPGLLFRHSGHRDKVVDFHWNSHDPWTIVSVSDDRESTGGGGTLQIWRMIDLIHRPQEEVLLSFIPRFSSHLWKALVLKTKQDMDIQDRELVNDWLMIIVYKERGFG
ncbi:unnamed protein product [Lactuca saligna]|uniref:Histone-binding protein RBBP4 N-terminal domain-containing protein n=1 Tax=Lactuca saligna TaxID=75948 RepID=A0AA36EHL2_LACSI|nr:unnamed protein product [Lactuca saligna]